MKTLDIAWLAGLLEGEASFMFFKGSPCIALQMADKDIVDRASRALSVNTHAPWKPKGKDSYKPIWTCRIHGARALGWMYTLYTYLGERRRAKIREISAQWKQSRRRGRPARNQAFPPLCHPDRKHSSLGLCDQCYMEKYRREHKATCHPERAVCARGLCRACYGAWHRAQVA